MIRLPKGTSFKGSKRRSDIVLQRQEKLQKKKRLNATKRLRKKRKEDSDP